MAKYYTYFRHSYVVDPRGQTVDCPTRATIPECDNPCPVNPRPPHSHPASQQRQLLPRRIRSLKMPPPGQFHAVHFINKTLPTALQAQVQ